MLDLKDIKIAYDLGISILKDFDKALADKGIDVYMCNHIIDKLPYNNKKFHWFKKELSASNNQNNNLMILMEMMK